MSKIGMLGAGRDDEMVVRDAAAFREQFSARRVDARNFRQNDLGIALPMEDAADRRCDISRRQTRGRDLVEQRLEQVVIVAIDDGDIKRRLRELLGRRKAAESRSDDDDARWPGCGMNGCHISFASLCVESPGFMPLPECQWPHWRR